jgi:hypothetical protein
MMRRAEHRKPDIVVALPLRQSPVGFRRIPHAGDTLDGGKHIVDWGQ